MAVMDIADVRVRVHECVVVVGVSTWSRASLVELVPTRTHVLTGEAPLHDHSRLLPELLPTTVKLDLQARGVIERTSSKPQTYGLT
jgi:hypothetical protein